MLVQNFIENAAVNVISASFASASVSGWNIYQGLFANATNAKIVFPCVKIICWTEKELYPEVHSGLRDVDLEIRTDAIKTQTSSSIFESVSDLVFNPFLTGSIYTQMSNYAPNINFKLICEAADGLQTITDQDGWVASQGLKIVCERTS